MPLEVMKIIDASDKGNPGKIKSEKNFNSSEISDLPFGWNVKNSLMRSTLQDLIEREGNCKLITGTRAVDFLSRDDAAYVKLSSGKTVKAKLVIGADGRNSVLRKKLVFLSKPIILLRKPWLLQLLTQFHIKIFQLRFMFLGGLSPLFHCRIMMESHHQLLFGWLRAKKLQSSWI